MSVTTTPDLSDPQEAILRALQGVDHVRRVDLAGEIDEPYQPHEETLTHRGLMEEVGVESETNEDGDTVIYRRFKLTSAGERALRAAAQPDSEPEPVEPEVRRNHRKDWYEMADWTTLSPAVGRLLNETQSVELIDEEHTHGPDGTVSVTMERNGTTHALEFSTMQWHQTGARKFNEQYRSLFRTTAGIKERPLSEEQWGSLKARLIAEFAEETTP